MDEVSGATAGLMGVTFDHVAAMRTMAISKAEKVPTRTKRFMEDVELPTGSWKRGTTGTAERSIRPGAVDTHGGGLGRQEPEGLAQGQAPIASDRSRTRSRAAAAR